MARVCQVTGKRPMVGHNVSHANNKTKRRFLPNLQEHRFWLESEKRFVKLRVTTKAMRKIDKYGVEAILNEINSGIKAKAIKKTKIEPKIVTSKSRKKTKSKE